jgi:uncharacterized iron-regulated membrane protein
MYHFIRKFHRWIGVIIGLVIILIASTGILLALKREFAWIQPPTLAGEKTEDFKDVISIEEAITIALSQGLDDLSEISHIDRVDYRPNKNVFKVVSGAGLHEVQVNGSTGEVLSIGLRRDNLFEAIHDLSFFSEFLRKFFLPIVGLSLLLIACSGFVIFFVPIVRRARFRREHGKEK